MPRFRILFPCALIAGALAAAPQTIAAELGDSPIYQLRTYYTAPGKLPVLLERFGTHNLPIFERHGVELLGAWVPSDEGEADRLVYLVAFPDHDAAEKAWSGFSADPDWQRISGAERDEHGTVVERAETVYLAPTDYGPAPAEVAASNGEHLYILRTYVTPPGKLSNLNARFRNHTVELFRKHGLNSFAYATPVDEAQGAENTLIYLVQVPDREAAEASWTTFRDDPEWQKVKAASETEGALTEKVESLYLKPADFSPLK